MKVVFTTVTVTCALGMTSTQASAHQDLVFTDVRVVEVDSGEINDRQTVAVEDGVIVYVGEKQLLGDEDTQFVSAAGRYLIPGLWDSHVHSLSNTSWHFPLFLAHGVTSVRNMHTTEPDGIAMIQELRAELESGARRGPRFIANGFMVSGEGSYWPEARIVRNAEEVRSTVDAHVREGLDFIKVYDELDGASYRTLLEYALERGIPVDGHLPFDIEPLEAIGLGQRTIEHSIELTVGCANPDQVAPEPTGSEALPHPLAAVDMLERYDAGREQRRCFEIAEAMALHGTSPVPTIISNYSFSHASLLAAQPEFQSLLPTRLANSWKVIAESEMFEAAMTLRPEPLAAARDHAAALEGEGVNFLAGTDVGNPFLVPGHSLLLELEFMVSVGISERSALAAATINPARAFGFENLGRIEARYLADLVLLERNPLDDISNIRTIVGVVSRGDYIPAEELDLNVEEALELVNSQ